MSVSEFIPFAISLLKPLYGDSESKDLILLLVEEVLLIKRAHVGIIDKEIDLAEEMKLTSCLERLKEGEPLQYILGYTWFKNHVFLVNPSVLIPRPETEELVDWVLEQLPSGEQLSILDVGTGSGAIAISLAKARPNWRVFGLEKSNEALQTAKANAKAIGAKVDWKLADLFSPEIPSWIKQEGIQVIVSNPPYIPEREKAEMHKNVLEYEPEMALFVPDSDPVKFYRKMLELPCKSWFFEIAASGEEAMRQLHPNLILKNDMSGNLRFASLRLS